MKAVEFGGGNIGRAFIGPLLYQAGFETTFVDINQQLIDQINKDHQYPVRYVSAQGTREIIVKNVDAIHSSDREAVNQKIVEADLITTSVGENQLKLIAPLLAEGLAERLRQRPNEMSLVVIACENVLGNTQMLKNLCLENSPEEVRETLVNDISWLNSVVDMVVPNTLDQDRKKDPLLVIAEDYQLFAVDETALKGVRLEIPGIKLTDRLDIIERQKNFSFNGTHTTIAYLGFPLGYKFIHQAMDDPKVDLLARGVIDEGNRAIISLYPEMTSEQIEFGNQNYQRFKNHHLLDELTRIGRGPIRKLGPKERLVLPSQILLDAGIVPIYHSVAIAEAYRSYNFPGDPQAVELARTVQQEGIEFAVEKYSGLPPTHHLARMIKASTLYKEL